MTAPTVQSAVAIDEPTAHPVRQRTAQGEEERRGEGTRQRRGRKGVRDSGREGGRQGGSGRSAVLRCCVVVVVVWTISMVGPVEAPTRRRLAVGRGSGSPSPPSSEEENSSDDPSPSSFPSYTSNRTLRTPSSVCRLCKATQRGREGELRGQWRDRGQSASLHPPPYSGGVADLHQPRIGSFEVREEGGHSTQN